MKAKRRRSNTPPLTLPVPRALAGGLDAHPSFTRGLSLGLLVGAAVAGSTIWGRLRTAQRRSTSRADWEPKLG